jgi:hypothetical protein
LESVTKLPALAAFTTMSVSCVFMAHDPSLIKNGRPKPPDVVASRIRHAGQTRSW